MKHVFLFLLAACSASYQTMHCAQAAKVNLVTEQEAKAQADANWDLMEELSCLPINQTQSSASVSVITHITTADTELLNATNDLRTAFSIVHYPDIKQEIYDLFLLRVKKALAAGANPNLKDSQGMPVFIHALRDQNQKFLPYITAKPLLQAFVAADHFDINTTDQHGNNALLLARKEARFCEDHPREYALWTACLIVLGANYNHKNLAGETFKTLTKQYEAYFKKTLGRDPLILYHFDNQK